jgi:hypothetical protein
MLIVEFQYPGEVSGLGTVSWKSLLVVGKKSLIGSILFDNPHVYRNDMSRN